jgi:hypothetical protein
MGAPVDRSRATNPLILVLTMIVIGATAAPRFSAQDAAASQTAPLTVSKTLQGAKSSGYRSLLKRYFGPDFESEHLCNPEPKYKVHQMVATLPDPSDPHLADAFDNYLASIELALAQDKYLADQFWLPWDEKRRRDRAKRPETVNNASGSSLVNVNAAPEATDDELLDQPGIVLFRKPHLNSQPKEIRNSQPNAGSNESRLDELFFLLLVPETPTTGVRRATLRAAFKQAAELTCQSEWPQTIRIVGPSFSGGAASLASGIEEWKLDGREFEFNIITGSATNSDTKRLLARVPNVSSFSATVLPDEVVSDFYQYLARQFGSTRIAVLTESNTSYGQGSQRDQRSGDPFVLQLSFPLHVSQVGAEYEKARAQRATASASEGVGQLLSINLLEEDQPHDVVPAVSALTKYTSEISLINSLAVIGRGEFDPVGILATDPRDELFLAQMIRQLIPDVQVFLMEAELLFSHPALVDQMRGALVVSRYPLYNLNQLWTPPVQMNPRVQFPNGASQGVYNAAILHLREIEKKEEKDPNLWPKPLEYGEPFRAQSTRPPLWVGMVGHNQIWPLETLPVESAFGSDEPSVALADAVKDYTAPFPPQDEKCAGKPCFQIQQPWLAVPQGRLHLGVAFFLFAFIAWHAAHWYAAGIKARDDAPGGGPASPPPSQPAADIRALGREALQRFFAGRHPLICQIPENLKKLSDDSRPKRAYASLLLFGWQALIATYIAVLAPLIGPLIAEWRLVPERARAIPSFLPATVELIFWGISVGACVLLLLALYLGKKRVPLKPLPLYWLAGLVVVLLSLAYLVQIAFGSKAATQVFLWVRASNWLSGISPTVPLIFLGAASYVTSWLTLYRFAGVPAVGAETRHLRTLLPDIGKRLTKAEERAEGVLEGQWIVGGLWVMIFMLLTAATIVIFTIRTTAEPYSWTWLVRVLLGLLIVAIVHGLVMLVQIWRAIRKTADELSGHSVVSTLKKMQGTLAAMLGLHPYAASPRSGQLLAAEHALLSELQELQQWAKDDTKLGDGIHWAVDQLKESTWPPYDKHDWARPAEEILALEVVRTLGRRVAIIRTLISVITIDALLLLLVTNLYPFQPHGSLSGLSWFLLLAVVIVTVWTLVELERHAILSYASGSKPGKVSWDASFVFHLILFAVLPVTALVAAHFPEIGRPIFDSLQPLLHSAR